MNRRTFLSNSIFGFVGTALNKGSSGKPSNYSSNPKRNHVKKIIINGTELSDLIIEYDWQDKEQEIIFQETHSTPGDDIRTNRASAVCGATCYLCQRDR